MRRTALAAALAGAAAGEGADPVVTIPGVGTVAGSVAHGGRSFKGIPYAAPPLGPRRWRPPAAYPAWNGTRPAREWAATCVGAAFPCQPPATALPVSEDCLFLNVETPAGASGLPVMVWFHGGGYATGCSNMYQRNQDADKPAVFVSVNYRLNAFGFAGSPALATPGGGTGNYGIQDQRLALAWVRDHIAAFGGDKDRVMIYGESAGGNSIVNHLAQPASWGLFHRAVAESGTYHGAVTMDKAAALFDKLVGKLNCSDAPSPAECARAAPAADVESAVKAPLSGALAGWTWGPTIDGVSLSGEPWELIKEGRHNTKVPVILGSNRDETAIGLFLDPVPMTEAEFDLIAARTVGAAKLAELKLLYRFNGSYPYPEELGIYTEWWWKAVRVSTDSGDSLGHCTVRSTARALAAAGNPGVYPYIFAHPDHIPVIPGFPIKPTFVTHGMELPFVLNCEWGGLFGTECPFKSADAAALAEAVSGYWYRFAATGDPNGGGAPTWPSYAAAADTTMRLDVARPGGGGVAVQVGLRKEACDWWDANP